MTSSNDASRQAAIAAFMPHPSFPTLDLDDEHTIVSQRVGVILTFCNARMIDGEMDDQAGHELNVHFDLDTPSDNLADLETDVLLQILNGATELFGDLSDLQKISLGYMGADRNPHSSDPRFQTIFEHLCRNRGKYFFQPSNRLAVEKAIIERTDGIVGSRGRGRGRARRAA